MTARSPGLGLVALAAAASWVTLHLLGRTGAHLAIVPPDFVMSRGMMRGLAQRADNRPHEKAGT